MLIAQHTFHKTMLLKRAIDKFSSKPNDQIVHRYPLSERILIVGADVIRGDRNERIAPYFILQ